MVTRDNFGLLPAQVAGVALLTDYVLTVSVSVAAGTAALASAFPALAPYVVPISIVVRRHHRVRQPARRPRVGPGLRGPDVLLHRQHGGPARAGASYQMVDRRACPSASPARGGDDALRQRRSTACCSGASLFVVLHAFASGRRGRHRRRGDLERRARVPQARVEERPQHARDHGLAARRDVPRPVGAGRAHARRCRSRRARRPSSRRSATSCTAASPLGRVLYLVAAGRHDAHPRARGEHELRRLPPARVVPRRRQLHAPPAHEARPPPRVLERDHLPRRRRRSCCCSSPTPRSTGSSRSTRSACSRRSRCRRPAWPSTTSRSRSRGGGRGFVINGSGAVLSVIVDVVIAVTKFTARRVGDHRARPDPGLLPVRLAKQYETEARGSWRSTTCPEPRHGPRPQPPRRAGARRPARPRVGARDAVRPVAAPRRAARRALRARRAPRATSSPTSGATGGLGDMALELVECPDRRLTRAAMTAAARVVADGKSEVCVRPARPPVRRPLAPHPARPDGGVAGPVARAGCHTSPSRRCRSTSQPSLSELEVFEEIQGVRLPEPGEFTRRRRRQRQRPRNRQWRWRIGDDRVARRQRRDRRGVAPAVRDVWPAACTRCG